MAKVSQKARSLSSAKTISDSITVGEGAERRFYDTCRSLGKSVKKARSQQDRNHIDFIVDGDTVDVKGIKKTNKHGQILLEIKNVQGKSGWCSKSGPTFVAFDFGAFFLLVKTIDLVKLCMKVCDLTDSVSKIDLAIHKAYSRRGREDLMTIVWLQEVLNSCKHEFLPYTPYCEPMELEVI